jgi:hypothetical protein
MPLSRLQLFLLAVAIALASLCLGRSMQIEIAQVKATLLGTQQED